MKTETRRVLRKLFRNPTSLLGIFLLSFFVAIAIFAPLLAPVEEGRDNPFRMPIAKDENGRMIWKSAPFPPSPTHRFGVIGKYDVWYGVIWGTRSAFRIGLIVSLISSAIGIVIGSIAGYFGGWLDEILMRITDMFMSIPFIVAAMIMTTILGKGLDKVTIALIIFGWMQVARLIRGNILQAKEEQYVLAGKALGVNDFVIIVKHLLPNTIFPVIVQISMRMGALVITSAALSFLGVGAEPGYADWGTILSYARNYMMELDRSWFAIVYPGTAMVLFVLAWNLVGDALRDIFDPKMRV
ncbi:MAG TPA: ABC transporter permease [Thermotogota bacterium]|nr:ABC transporter permease [Thermotogota bacterium]HRW92290.1 ABC transporter permease [Thermotogota bacterium]